MLPRLFKAALIGAMIPVLSGCVAAVVPLAAGGAILGRGDKKDVEEQAVDAVSEAEIPDEAAQLPPEPDPIVTVEPTDTSEAAASDGFVVEQPAEEAVAEPAPTTTKPIESGNELPSVDESDPGFIGPPSESPARPTVAEPAPADGAEEPQEPVEASPSEPQPAEPAPPASVPPSEPVTNAPPAPVDFRAYDVFYGYVEQQARRDPVSDARQSALLASPGSLSPRRTECSIRPPAVLIDLDPAGSAISLTENQTPDPALTQILLSLRLQEIEVFWISERPAIDAGAIRRALVQGGLDPQGRDGLLLMRREDDRKQTRRQELGETHCLLAIAGDDRADFDELYLYLRDRSAAQPLEELIGAGWFLTPLPLTEGR